MTGFARLQGRIADQTLPPYRRPRCLRSCGVINGVPIPGGRAGTWTSEAIAQRSGAGANYYEPKNLLLSAGAA
jgi:hypothetical protein